MYSKRMRILNSLQLLDKEEGEDVEDSNIRISSKKILRLVEIKSMNKTIRRNNNIYYETCILFIFFHKNNGWKNIRKLRKITIKNSKHYHF